MLIYFAIKLSPKFKNIILFVLWCISGLIGFSMLILITFFDVHWICCFLFLIFLGICISYSPYFVLSNRFQGLSARYGVTEWVRSTEFKDDEIILSDHTLIIKFEYEDIKEIKEKNNVIIIFFHKNRNRAIRLYKDTFVEGSWEECKNKINSMMK